MLTCFPPPWQVICLLHRPGRKGESRREMETEGIAVGQIQGATILMLYESHCSVIICILISTESFKQNKQNNRYMSDSWKCFTHFLHSILYLYVCVLVFSEVLTTEKQCVCRVYSYFHPPVSIASVKSPRNLWSPYMFWKVSDITHLFDQTTIITPC